MEPATQDAPIHRLQTRREGESSRRRPEEQAALFFSVGAAATGQFIVDPDALNGQLGCVLLQEQEDKDLKPIAYWSRLLCSAERNYNTMHKECVTVVW